MKQLSNCHKAPAIVDTADEGTSCYMCSECNSPCDLWVRHTKRLEEMLTSLEISKKLKELGIKQDSLFYWEEATEKATHIADWAKLFIGWNQSALPRDAMGAYGRNHPWQNDFWNSFSAFTGAELGKMLPLARWNQESTVGGFRIILIDEQFPHGEIAFTWDKTEADARAMMLIYLIENNLLKL